MIARLARPFTALLVCMAVAAPPALAADGAAEFIRKMGAEAVQTVNAKNLSDADRERRFGKLFREAFAVPVIGRFVLGQYWRRATEAEQKEYLKLFQDYIVQTYTDRFKGYQGVNFRVGEAKPVREREELVPSEVLRPGGQPPIAVQWRVRGDGGYKIVDVIAEGVSMLISQRDEFAAIINRSGGKVAGLIDELRRRTERG